MRPRSGVLAAALLAACGGSADEPPAAHPPPVATDTFLATPPGTVDTAGMGVAPPTAGGQLVDTAAAPGPTDTAEGTPAAP